MGERQNRNLLPKLSNVLLHLAENEVAAILRPLGLPLSHIFMESVGAGMVHHDDTVCISPGLLEYGFILLTLVCTYKEETVPGLPCPTRPA